MANGSGLVATLVAGAQVTLPQALIDSIIRKTGGSSAEWLAADKAADVFFPNALPQHTDERLAEIRTQLGDAPVDVIVQPVANRRKTLLVADMESTLIEQEMLDELAQMIGVGPHVAAITRRAMNGELDFIAALQERVGLLKDIPAIILEHVAHKITLMPGAARLVATMKAQDAYTVIMSGGFTCFTDKVAARLGCDAAYANHLLIENDLIAGRVAEPVLDRQRKKTLLEEICAQRGIGMEQAVAVGDGANDIPMLQACARSGGLGVAYQAKPAVRDAVPQQINHSDLTTLLFAQGYRAADFR